MLLSVRAVTIRPGRPRGNAVIASLNPPRPRMATYGRGVLVKAPKI